MDADGDLRGDLEAALEQLGGTPEEAAETPEPVEADAAPAPEAGEESQAEAEPTQEETSAAEERERDEKGRFAKAEKEAKQAKPAVQTPTKPPPAATQTGTAPPVQGEATPTLKPPSSWKPAAREKWAALPPEVQQEAVRRERETAVALQEAAEARKFHGSFQQTISPYLGMIQAEGSEPLKAVGNLLQTAAALRTAPPVHKAQIVANLVRNFGVPIEALDAALAGQPMPQQIQQQAFDPNAFAQQVKESIFGELKQQREQAAAARAQQEIESFATEHEFLDDVRDDMADLLEMAAKRGIAMTTEQAYNKAVALHPEISGVLAQRKQASAKVPTQRKLAAASSVKSQPGGMAAPAQKGDDLRGTLEAVMEQLSQ